LRCNPGRITGGAANPPWCTGSGGIEIGNPLSLLANLIFLSGLATWLHAGLTGRAWAFSQYQLHPTLLAATLALLSVQIGVRMFWVSRIYGSFYALGVPLRMVWGNYINASAAFRAIFRYLLARVRHQPLVWVKTEHAYPTRDALLLHKRRLGEVLVGSGYLDPERLESALATQPVGTRIGEHLVNLGAISEDELYEALSLQQSLPLGRIDPIRISTKVARALPREMIHRWKILPFRMKSGSLFLASPEIPTDELSRQLRGFTRMSLQFQLITPANFEELTRALL
jgi:adsorption protein B